MDRFVERVFESMPIPVRVVVIWMILAASVFWLMPIAQHILQQVMRWLTQT